MNQTDHGLSSALFSNNQNIVIMPMTHNITNVTWF